MANLVERTMISAGEIGGQPKRAGQIVALDPIQLKAAAGAGLVHEDEAGNAAVPKADLPAGYGSAASFEADIQEAAATASRQIEALRARVIEAQTKSDTEIAGHRQRVTEASEQADREIAAHRERVAEADKTMSSYLQTQAEERTRLEGEIAALRQAASEQPPADGADETPPADDADGAEKSKPAKTKG